MPTPKPLTPLKRIRLEGNPRHHRYVVAQAIGVTDRTLRNWEEGDSSPNLDQAVKLADFYRVSLDEIAGRSVAKAG